MRSKAAPPALTTSTAGQAARWRGPMLWIQQRERHSSELLWELRGRTTDAVTCVLRRAHNGAYLVCVILGDNAVYAEPFDQEQEALHHAAFLCDDYMKSGWRELRFIGSRCSGSGAEGRN